MGIYTEIRTDFILRPDIPEDVLRVLKVMAGKDPDVAFEDREKFQHGQQHPLFKTSRWDVMLTMGSASFDADPEAEFEETGRGLGFQSVSNFKNYEDEIALFADWIRPYIHPQEKPFVTSAYEEFPEVLTRYFTDGHTDRLDTRPEDDRWF